MQERVTRLLVHSIYKPNGTLGKMYLCCFIYKKLKCYGML